MGTIDAWRHWASQRGMRFYAAWDRSAGSLLNGGVGHQPTPVATLGWVGSYGGLPCFGYYTAGPFDNADGAHVVAVRLPGVNFPPLKLEPADYTLGRLGLAIDPEFDLQWCVTGPHAGFARDVVCLAMRNLLVSTFPDFHCLWFEGDAVALRVGRGADPADVDRHLNLLRRLIDTIPSTVINAVHQPIQRTGASFPPARSTTPPARAVEDRSSTWPAWTRSRGWLYYANAREIVERFNEGPVPTGRFTHGFVGRFGDLPCFGWQWEGAGRGPRQVLCVRKPGMTMAAVRVTQDDALLSELVGTGDVVVGDPTFDTRWRVTSPDAHQARKLLGPRVWGIFDGTHRPFSQLWLEREVAAVILDGPVPRHQVDDYLRLLHRVLTAVTSQTAG